MAVGCRQATWHDHVSARGSLNRLARIRDDSTLTKTLEREDRAWSWVKSRRSPSSCRRIPAATSERILQCQLKLAHGDGRIVDHPEALPRGIGRRSRKCRTGENVRLRRTPGRVVQHVERFHAEL